MSAEPGILAFPLMIQKREPLSAWLGRLCDKHDASLPQLFRHLDVDEALAASDLIGGVKSRNGVDRDATTSLVTRFAIATEQPAPRLWSSLMTVGVRELLPPGRRVYACASCWQAWSAAGIPCHFIDTWMLTACWCCETHLLPLVDVTRLGLDDHDVQASAFAAAVAHSQAIARTFGQRPPTRRRLKAAHQMILRGATPPKGSMRTCHEALSSNRFHLSTARTELMCAAATRLAMATNSTDARGQGDHARQFERIFIDQQPLQPALPAYGADELLMPALSEIAATLLQILKRRFAVPNDNKRPRRTPGKLSGREPPGRRLAVLTNRLEVAMRALRKRQAEIPDDRQRAAMLRALENSIEAFERLDPCGLAIENFGIADELRLDLVELAAHSDPALFYARAKTLLSTIASNLHRHSANNMPAAMAVFRIFGSSHHSVRRHLQRDTL